MRVVAIGGGHGLAASIRALRRLDDPTLAGQISEVVADRAIVEVSPIDGVGPAHHNRTGGAANGAIDGLPQRVTDSLASSVRNGSIIGVTDGLAEGVMAGSTDGTMDVSAEDEKGHHTNGMPDGSVDGASGASDSGDPGYGVTDSPGNGVPDGSADGSAGGATDDFANGEKDYSAIGSMENSASGAARGSVNGKTSPADFGSRMGPIEVSAVVSVADDGASSGRLRAELGILPPGDLRKTLVAMAGDHPAAALTAELFEHRLGGSGPLAGHAVGNLLLAGLLERHDDAATAVAEAARMLDAAGAVLPAAEQPLVLDGDVLTPDAAEAVRVRGQAQLVRTRGRVRELRLEPADAAACPAAVEAITNADAVVIGPGSWFTSVLAPLLVPAIGAAVADTAAPVVLVLNLAAGPGETAGMTAAEHLEVLAEHLPRLRCDMIIVDPSVADDGSDAGEQDSEIRGYGGDRLEAAAQSLGGRVVRTPVAKAGGMPQHDEGLLALALRSALGWGGNGRETGLGGHRRHTRNPR